MKHQLRPAGPLKRQLLAAAFLVAALFFLPGAASAVEMKVYYEDKEQPPYYLGNSEDIPGGAPGVAVEMVRMLPEKIPELAIILGRRPWARCLAMLKSGAADAIFNASFSPDRLDTGRYPMANGRADPKRRIATISYSLYVLGGSPVSFDGRTVTGLTTPVGAPLGYSVVNDLKRMGLEVEEAPSTHMNLTKLIRGRVAACALQDVSAAALISRHPEFKDIVRLTPPLESKAYYLMLSRQFVDRQPELAMRIWDALREIRESEGRKLEDKYAR